MFVQRKNATAKETTMDDMHLELSGKYESPNRGLKPSTERQLSDPIQKPVSDFQKMFEEFKARLQAKSAEK